MNVKVKKLRPDAIIPTRGSAGAVGWDLYAVEDVYIDEYGIAMVPTGIAIDMELGWEVQCRPRSGMARDGMWALFGTIDNDYRGELMVVVMNFTDYINTIHKGDRIAQLVFAPIAKVEWEACEELSETIRGSGGFGSTDNK